MKIKGMNDVWALLSNLANAVKKDFTKVMQLD